DHPAQDRKVAAGLFVESHLVSACWSTVSGRLTQRSRVGRTSVCRMVSTSSVVSFTASATDLPSTDSATTSAEAVQIAQESPAKRAAATCPSATRSIRRTRSPQSGLTSSATAEDVNPLCGDRVRLMLRVADGQVAAARFAGDSCAICTASADVVAESVEGKSVAEAV